MVGSVKNLSFIEVSSVDGKPSISSGIKLELLRVVPNVLIGPISLSPFSKY